MNTSFLFKRPPIFWNALLLVCIPLNSVLAVYSCIHHDLNWCAMHTVAAVVSLLVWLL